MNFEKSLNSHESLEGEKEPKLICDVVFMRHASALYRTDIPHDLTTEGIASSLNTGESLKGDGFFNDEVHNLFYISPTERAKGTLHYVLEGANASAKNVVSSPSIGQTKFKDYKRYLDEIRTLGTKEECKESAAEHYWRNE